MCKIKGIFIQRYGCPFEKDKNYSNYPFKKDKKGGAFYCNVLQNFIHNPVDNSENYPQNYPQVKCR